MNDHIPRKENDMQQDITITRDQAITLGRLAEQLSDTDTIYLRPDPVGADSVEANLNDEHLAEVAVYSIREHGKAYAQNSDTPTPLDLADPIADNAAQSVKMAATIGYGYAAGSAPSEGPWAVLVVRDNAAAKLRATLDALADVARDLSK